MLAIMGPAEEWQISNRQIEKRKGILSMQAEFGLGQTLQRRSGQDRTAAIFAASRGNENHARI
jgi:hypothetical protein